MALDAGSIGTPAHTEPSERYALSGLSFPPRSGGPLPLTKPRTATPLRRPRAIRLSVHQIVCSRMFMITDIGKNYYISGNL